MRQPLFVLPLLLILCFLLLASFASAKSYRVEVTRVVVNDCHYATVEATTDAPAGAYVIAAAYNHSWQGLFDLPPKADGSGHISAVLRLTGFVTGFDVAVSDTKHQPTGVAEAHYFVFGGRPYMVSFLHEYGLPLLIALAAFLITGLLAASRGYTSGRFGKQAWLLFLPLAGLPFALRRRFLLAWCFQLLQWALVGLNPFVNLLRVQVHAPLGHAVWLTAYALFWWIGWLIALGWVYRDGDVELDRLRPPRVLAWPALLMQLLASRAPGLAQLLQGRPATACAFLAAQFLLTWCTAGYVLLVYASGPNYFDMPYILAHRMLWLDYFVALVGKALVLLCLLEAAWFARRATKASRPSLAEEEAKAG